MLSFRSEFFFLRMHGACFAVDACHRSVTAAIFLQWHRAHFVEIVGHLWFRHASTLFSEAMPCLASAKRLAERSCESRDQVLVVTERNRTL